jgi:hypothetical protein
MIFLRLDPLLLTIQKRSEYETEINDVYDDVAFGRYRPNTLHISGKIFVINIFKK